MYCVMNQITQIPPAKQARSFQLKSRCMAGHSCHYCIHANTRRHLHKHTDTVRSSPEADNTLVRLLLLAVSLRLYKGLQMTAFDPTPPPRPSNLQAVYPHRFDKISAMHTQKVLTRSQECVKYLLVLRK